MSLLKLTEELKYWNEIVKDEWQTCGGGHICEERGNPVTRGISRQSQGPGLNSLTPSTSPHVHTINKYKTKKEKINYKINTIVDIGKL